MVPIILTQTLLQLFALYFLHDLDLLLINQIFLPFLTYAHVVVLID